MSGADSALAFFDGEDVDLYGTLGIDEHASPDDVRRAYKRLSLIHHPDKVATRSPSEQNASKTAFQRVGFAYAVLSDASRRARFDRTGRTDEGGFGAEPNEGWDAYFAELWDGEVNAETLTDFYDSYEGSLEELQDLTNAFHESNGDIEYILAHVPARNNLEAETHFAHRINSAITEGQLSSTRKWSAGLQNSKAREKRHKAAKREAKEAEEAAKELGVHDKLFKKTRTKSPSKDAEQGSEDALRALIQQRGRSRMEALIENLETRYNHDNATKRHQSADGPAKGKKSRIEPSEADFQRAQAAIDARRRKP